MYLYSTDKQNDNLSSYYFWGFDNEYYWINKKQCLSGLLFFWNQTELNIDLGIERWIKTLEIRWHIKSPTQNESTASPSWTTQHAEKYSSST